jgi:effector-binding domain-containing protein
MRVVVLLILFFTGAQTMAGNIEELEWELLDTLGAVEIRSYPPSIQAVTELPGSNASTTGFKRLAGYIFGENEGGQAIAMTAPVQETLGVERPVMAFTMPAEYALEDLPSPSNASVAIVEVPGRTVASVSFSGWATGGKVQRMQQELVSTLEESGLEVIGAPVLNQYNPPWTLPFMRRNEVSVEVAYPEADSVAVTTYHF